MELGLFSNDFDDLELDGTSSDWGQVSTSSSSSPYNKSSATQLIALTSVGDAPIHPDEFTNMPSTTDTDAGSHICTDSVLGWLASGYRSGSVFMAS